MRPRDELCDAKYCIQEQSEYHGANNQFFLRRLFQYLERNVISQNRHQEQIKKSHESPLRVEANGDEAKERSKNRLVAATKRICRRMGGVIVKRNILPGATVKTLVKRTMGARTRKGVSMKGARPANRSTRSAAIKPMLPTRQTDCSFFNMGYNFAVFAEASAEDSLAPPHPFSNTG